MKENEVPEKIFLQIYDEDAGELEPGEITWCEHRQHETDIEYVKA